MNFHSLRKPCQETHCGVWGWFKHVLLVACVACSLSAWASHHEPPAQPLQQVRIGVLALRGIPQAQADWSATADYLTDKIPGCRFEIVPLAFDQLETNVADGKVDFVIVNPAIYVALAEHFGISPVATMINRLDDYDSSSYGGVVFRRMGSTGPPSFQWIKGKRFLAVAPMSLGGFLAARFELYKQDIDPYTDFSTIEFVGTHDAVVLGVIEGRADAGTARTDVLERMAAEGKIDLSTIEVIAPYRNATDGVNHRFPYLRSTRLYPEWPFAKVSGVPDQLARQVSMALLAMPEHSAAARNAQIYGWNVPMSYMPVVELLRELKLSPFEPEPMTLQVFIEKQPLASFAILSSCMVIIGFIGLLLLFNNRLCRAKDSLVKLNEQLEDRVKERTAVLEAKERELESLATHDALTGLLNRRALESRMLEEINRVNRYGEKLSVLMVDIDYFKKINDMFGHGAGDVVLCELATILGQTLRNTDVVARYGGEEFIILLPMTAQSDAGLLAERIRQKIELSNMVLGDGTTVHVTVSIGVTSAEHTGYVRSDKLIDAADKAMYSAKHNGRNRVCIG